MKLPKDAQARLKAIQSPTSQETIHQQAVDQVNAVKKMNEEINLKGLAIRTTVELEGISITTNGQNEVLEISGEGIDSDTEMVIVQIFKKLTIQNQEKMKDILIEEHLTRYGMTPGDIGL